MNNVNSNLAQAVFNTVNKSAKHSPKLDVVVLVDLIEKFLYNFLLSLVQALEVAVVQFFGLSPFFNLKMQIKVSYKAL